MLLRPRGSGTVVAGGQAWMGPLSPAFPRNEALDEPFPLPNRKVGFLDRRPGASPLVSEAPVVHRG